MSTKGLSGIIALFIAAFVAGALLYAAFIAQAAPQLDPIAAYCRGYADGQGVTLLAQGRISEDTYRSESPTVEASCDKDLRSPDSILREVLRGPLSSSE